MEITKVTVKKETKENSRFLGFAEIVIDNCFVVKNLRIIQGKERIFVAMPSIKGKGKDKYQDVAHPLNQECRKMIEETILKEYQSLE